MLSDRISNSSSSNLESASRLNALSSIVCFLTRSGVLYVTGVTESLNALSSIVCFLTNLEELLVFLENL